MVKFESSISEGFA